MRDRERQYFAQFVAVVKEKNTWTLTEAAKVDVQEELDNLEEGANVPEPYTAQSPVDCVDFVDDDPRSSPISPDDWEAVIDSFDDYLDGHPLQSKEGFSRLRSNAKKSGNTRLYKSAKEFIRSWKDQPREP